MALVASGAAEQHGAMVITTSPQALPPTELVRYLRQELGLSENSISLGLKQAQLEQAPLSVVLWRFGLISLEQLDQVLSWQDNQG